MRYHITVWKIMVHTSENDQKSDWFQEQGPHDSGRSCLGKHGSLRTVVCCPCWVEGASHFPAGGGGVELYFCYSLGWNPISIFIIFHFYHPSHESSHHPPRLFYFISRTWTVTIPKPSPPPSTHRTFFFQSIITHPSLGCSGHFVSRTWKVPSIGCQNRGAHLCWIREKGGGDAYEKGRWLWRMCEVMEVVRGVQNPFSNKRIFIPRASLRHENDW